jgi:YhcH/YjgK/YiaL family protein
MITDSLAHARVYVALGSRLQQAFDYLRQTEFSGLAPGTYEIDGRNLYAVVQRYTTKPMQQGKWEAHRRYLDVQFVAAGIERIGYAAGSSMGPGLYDEERDFEELTGVGDYVTLRAGDLMVLWPGEGHMPGVAAGSPSEVTKVVVKVLMD